MAQQSPDHRRAYEETTPFEGYPAKRPWYPFASDIYQEVLPSAAMGYPYHAKILFHYMGDPAYATFIPPYLDALDQPVEDQGFELTLITHRIPTMTKSRTISNYWLLNVRPENHVEIAASDLEINSQKVAKDPRRAVGIHANAAMRVDPVLGDVSLSDLTGGSVVFYETQVRLERVF
jgi:hypothetical protein